MQHRKIISLIGLVSAFTLSAGGCALFGKIAPGPAAAKGAKIKVVNETSGTELCKLSVGNPNLSGYEELPLDLGPGESVEMETPLSGPDGERVCVKMCHPEHGELYVGCVPVLLSAEKVETIALVEGKQNKPPKWTPKGHTLDIKNKTPALAWRREDDTLAMYNLSDPNLLEWTGGAKDPWGDWIPGTYDITVENPNCKAEVGWATENNKGDIEQWFVDIEHTERLVGEDSPIYVMLAPTGKRLVYMWDLREGVYVFQISKNCKSIDLVSQEQPEGVEAAKKLSKSHEKNKR